MLKIGSHFKALFSSQGILSFEDFWNFPAEPFKLKKDRAIYRLDFGGQSFFLKKYFSLSRFRRNEALNEWQAAKKLKEKGFRVPQPVAYGERYRSLLKKEAFVLFTEAPGSRLEDLFRKEPSLGLEMAPRLARFAACFHGAGFSHQDFYLCHIFWHEGNFYLIDLQRVRFCRRPPISWFVKDLAELFYSARNVLGEAFSGFWESFKEHYAKEMPRRTGNLFWRRVEWKMARIARHDSRIKKRQIKDSDR